MPTVVVVTPTVLLARAVPQQKRWNVGVVTSSVTRAAFPVAFTLVARRRQARTLPRAVALNANAIALANTTDHTLPLVLERLVSALGALDFAVSPDDDLRAGGMATRTSRQSLFQPVP